MRKTLRLWSVLLAAVMTLTLSTPAFAAVKDDPYGYVVLDQEENIWHFQTYEYNSSERAYEIEDYAFLRGNNLLDRKGKIIYNDVMEMDTDFDFDYEEIQEQADKPTVAFDGKYFYFITEDGEIARMDETTDSTYEVAKSISNAKYFVLDNDDFVTKVVYSSNSSKAISSLSFSGSHKRSTSSSSSKDDDLPDEYVFTYMYDGDPEKIGYDAYYDGEVLISIYCKNNNIWVESENFLLSESSVGAKFVGYSEGYQVVRYDNNGKIGLTPYDKWSKTYWISLNYEIMSFEKDENGFIEYIVTSGTKYNLQDLIEQYDYDEYDFDGDIDDDDDDDDDEAEIYDNISYVERSNSKAVAYKSNDKELATIKKSNNYLYYEDLKLKNSYKASDFSFIEDEGYVVWINNDDELWYYDGNKEELYKKDVSSITYDDNEFAYKYKVNSKSYSFDF